MRFFCFRVRYAFSKMWLNRNGTYTALRPLFSCLAHYHKALNQTHHHTTSNLHRAMFFYILIATYKWRIVQKLGTHSRSGALKSKDTLNIVSHHLFAAPSLWRILHGDDIEFSERLDRHKNSYYGTIITLLICDKRWIDTL